MSLRVLAAGALGLVAAQGTEDASILLQLQTEKTNDCACLNWQSVYAKGVKCGWDGHELSFVHEDKEAMKTQVVSWTGPEYCDAFFQHINGNFCVNNGQNNEEGHMKHGQWCYVDSKCDVSQHDGAVLASNVDISWKMCSTRQGDEMLRDKSVEELVTVSKRHNLDLALLAKMSYPVWGQHEQVHTMWPYLKAAFGLGEAGAKEAMVDDDRWGMENLMAEDKPMIIKSNEKGWPPLALVKGDNVYEIRSTGVFPPAKEIAMFPAKWSQLHHVKMKMDATATDAPDATEDANGFTTDASASSEDASCQCLNWKETYAQKKVKCGWEGHELDFVHEGKADMISKVVPYTGPEYCDAFFQHIDDNFCVNNGQNYEVGHMKHGQWCYVDSKCSKLKQGKAVNDVVSWKMCSKSEGDNLLRDKNIRELEKLSEKHDIDLALLAKMSFPVWGQHEQKHTMWPYLKAFFNLGAADAEPMAADDKWGMKFVQQSNKAMVFKANEKGWPPVAVVQGENVYEIQGEFPPPKEVQNTPGKWTKLACLSGPDCDN